MLHCYKGEIPVDPMEQTRGQEAGDQSPLGSGTLQGVTTEGDTVAMTICALNTLKHTVPAPGADHSANTLQSTHVDKEGLAS